MQLVSVIAEIDTGEKIVKKETPYFVLDQKTEFKIAQYLNNAYPYIIEIAYLSMARHGLDKASDEEFEQLSPFYAYLGNGFPTEIYTPKSLRLKFNYKYVECVEDLKKFFHYEIREITECRRKLAQGKPFGIQNEQWYEMLNFAQRQIEDYILIKLEILSKGDYVDKDGKKFNIFDLKEELEKLLDIKILSGTGYDIKSIPKEIVDKDIQFDTNYIIKTYNKKIAFEWNSIDKLYSWLVYAINNNKAVCDTIDDYVKEKQKKYWYAIGIFIIFLWLIFQK